MTFAVVHDVGHRGVGALHHVGQFRIDLGTEQVSGAGDDCRGEEPRTDKGNRFRKSAPAGERLGNQSQQHGNENRPDHDQNDIEQKPDQHRDQCDQNDDHNPRKKFDRRHLPPRLSVSVQRWTPVTAPPRRSAPFAMRAN